MLLRRLFFVFNIIAVLSLLAQGGNYQAGQAASPVLMEGTFNIIWGDGTPETGDTRTSYFLSTAQDDTIQLVIDEDLLTSMGGPITLNRKLIVVQGTWLEVGKTLQVQSISLANGEGGGTQGVYGPQPWVSILCKFKDYTIEPKNLDYFQQMYSKDYPGLDHFWREQSYNLANLVGSGAFGWYVLPHDREYYFDADGHFLHGYAVEDCTGVADPYVNFSPYVGINLMFNADLDGYAWGGGWNLCLDGICKAWRMTWEPPWGYENIGVIGHETGHGFGLPHSYWNPLAVYDNQWDVMSDVWSNGSRGGNDPRYGTMGQHTIFYHKDILGWIDDSQRAIIGTGKLQTLTLERLALPQNDNYLGVRILVDGSPDHFLTVEARQLAGYDAWLPRQAGWDQAVVLHDIHVYDGMPARVIDIDQNGNTGDAGAIWLPGETYITPTLGIEVSVLSATDTGFVVKISNRFTPMSDIAIEGPGVGYVSETIPFTATVSPSDATTPITYTWEATGLPPVMHIGDTVDSIDFTWEDTGTKAITVTASNAGGMVVDTHVIDITQKVPIVSLTGPILASVGALNMFTATVVPTDVTLPITYSWQASGQMPITHTTGLSDTVSYAWEDPGMQVITVTAMNIHGSTTDTFSLPVYIPPANLEINGPVVGDVQGNYTFIANVDPITSTVPITYVWSVDEQFTITHTAGVSDTASFTWDYPGLHQLTVSAANPAGSVVDTWSITIFVKVFLPLSLRN